MTQKEHEAILPVCINEFYGIRAEIADIKENHLTHINEKIDLNTKWTKWSLGIILTFVGLAFSAIGVVIALVSQ